MKVRIGRRPRTSAGHAMRSPLERALGPAFSEGAWDIPDRFNFTRDVVEVLAADTKRRALTCLANDGVIEPRTFHQIVESTARWAALLKERGVTAGDRVVVVVGPRPEWLEIMLAGLKIGAVTVPCTESIAADSLAVRVETSGARLVVASRNAEREISRLTDPPDVVYTDERRGRSSDAPPKVPTEDTSSRDIAFVLSTAGTARGPFGVAHTHGATFAARVQTEHWLDAGPGDAVWCTADTGNALAVWNVLLGPWSRGAETILHHGDFDPRERLDLIDRLGATILCQTPAEYEALTELREFKRYRPRRLRRLVSTADMLDPDVIAAYEDIWGMTIHEGYGGAEMGVVVANGIDAGFRAGSVGLPIVGYDVAVIDDQGNVLEPGDEGELALRGRPPALFSHYLERPDETKAAFRGEWYVTGDVAATDEDGFVWLAGRAEDMITSRGHRFGPTDIERTLKAHAAVVESAAVGIRDLERGGHFVRAFVVLGPRSSPSETLEAELRSFVGSSLPEYQVPREIDFVDELPRTPSGNVRRAELRERAVVGRSLWQTGAGPDSLPVVVEPEPEPEAEARTEPSAYATPAPEPLAPMRPEIERVWPEDAEPVLSGTVESIGPAELEPVAYLEADQGVGLDPEPVALDPAPPVALDPEPVAYVDPEPVPREPEAVARVETEPVPLEPDAVTTETEAESATIEPVPGVPDAPEPEVVAYLAPEPSVAPEPTLEPEPTVEPTTFEPTPEPEPEPEPVAYVEPAPAPPLEAPEPTEPVVSEPVPEPEASVLLDPESIVPTETSGQAASEPATPTVEDPAEATAQTPTPEPLPDYIVPPNSTKAELTDAGDEPVTFEGLAPVTSFKLDRGGDTSSRKRHRREKPAVADEDNRNGPRSTGEPGDETEEVDWMEGLSTRLSAYSLSQDDEPAERADDTEHEPDDDA